MANNLGMAYCTSTFLDSARSDVDVKASLPAKLEFATSFIDHLPESSGNQLMPQSPIVQTQLLAKPVLAVGFVKGLNFRRPKQNLK